MLLGRVFEAMKTSMNKHELRYLMKKLRFPEEKIQDLETTFHGKEKLPERIVNAMQFWREYKGSLATLSELIRILHIINMESLSQKLKAMQIYSQALRL